MSENILRSATAEPLSELSFD